jgi:hypothetical protein
VVLLFHLPQNVEHDELQLTTYLCRHGLIPYMISTPSYHFFCYNDKFIGKKRPSGQNIELQFILSIYLPVCSD